MSRVRLLSVGSSALCWIGGRKLALVARTSVKRWMMDVVVVSDLRLKRHCANPWMISSSVGSITGANVRRGRTH